MTLSLKAIEELTLVKLLLNTRHFKFEISFSPLIVLIRYKINFPKVIQLRRRSGWVKTLACLSHAIYYWESWNTAPYPIVQRFLEAQPGPVKLFPPLKGL